MTARVPGYVMDRDDRQVAIFAWARDVFSEEQARSLPQRGLRLLEEAVEAFQACGGDEESAHRLVAHVFGRPPGELSQELGGVGVTTLALAAAAGVSADDAERREVERVLAMPVEELRKRNQAKCDVGLLLLEPRGGPGPSAASPPIDSSLWEAPSPWEAIGRAHQSVLECYAYTRPSWVLARGGAICGALELISRWMRPIDGCRTMSADGRGMRLIDGWRTMGADDLWTLREAAIQLGPRTELGAAFLALATAFDDRAVAP